MRAGTRHAVVPFLLVAVGAALGANARYWVSARAADRFGVDFPYGTLIINASGSFAIGFLLATLTAQAGVDPEARLLVATGFLGGYTTFSTFAWETAALLRRGTLLPTLANWLGSACLGVAAAALGVALAGWLR